MEKRWVIFRRILIIQLVIAVVILFFTGIQLYKFLAGIDNDQNPPTILASVFSCIFLFDIFHLYLLQKRYPNRSLSTANKILSGILFILMVISTLCLFFMFVVAIDEANKSQEETMTRIYISMLIFTVIYIPGMIYALISSVKLKRFIGKNADADMFKTINEIGSEKGDNI